MLKQEIIFRVFAHSLPADNPQQAENASVMTKGSYGCRYDMVGGTAAECEKEDRYDAHYTVSIGVESLKIRTFG